MTTKTFDPSKPVQTRDGRKARILCTDRRSAHPIVALIESRGGGVREIPFTYKPNGSWRGTQDRSDLVNVPERVSMFYGKTGSGNLFSVYSVQGGLRCSNVTKMYPYLLVIELIYEDGVLIEAKEHFRD